MITLAISAHGRDEFPLWQRLFHQIAPEIRTVWWKDQECVEADVDYLLVWKPEPGEIARFPALRGIFCTGAGVDHLLADPEWPLNIPLVRMGGERTAALMAEYVVWAALSLLRESRTWAWQQERHIFNRKLITRTTSETPIGIMGLGNLGRVTARRLRQLEFPVLGWSRSGRPTENVEIYSGGGELPLFLGKTHILVNLLPDTPETRNLIASSLIRQLPRGAGIINVGRGNQIVEADLIAALDDNHLSGAVLDVFREEPLPQASPFWNHSRIIVTPHAASEASRADHVQYLVNVIHQMERGDTPALLYRPERGY